MAANRFGMEAPGPFRPSKMGFMLQGGGEGAGGGRVQGGDRGIMAAGGAG